MSVVAQRYAAALADVAMEHKSADAVKRDLATFIELFYSTPDLRNALDSPAVNREVKNKVIATIAARAGWNVAVRNFVSLVVDHRRTEILREIERVFSEELNRRLGIEDAEVTSARALTAEEKKELTNALELRRGKKIEARFRESEGLLAGAVVRLGSTVYDGSVREQLNRLRQQLESE